MTIGKKLYISFGAVLAMVLVLFLVNYLAVQREHSAKAAASQALERAESTDKIRSQMMQNRLFLSSYLLSGDTRMVDRMREGIQTLEQELHAALALANSDQQRSALQRVQQSEQSWAQDFATPLVDKRKQVDGGNATVAELQIFYLQKDASSWLKNTTDYLDQADEENHRLLNERKKSDETAATATIAVALFSTLLALGGGGSDCLQLSEVDQSAAAQPDASRPSDRDRRRPQSRNRF